jgi:hypothetical protein
MPRFKVPVVSETPAETSRALDAAGIPKVGPTFTRFTSSDGDWRIGPRMTPVFDAENADAAEARVREVVGSECEVGKAEPFGPGS